MTTIKCRVLDINDSFDYTLLGGKVTYRTYSMEFKTFYLKEFETSKYLKYSTNDAETYEKIKDIICHIENTNTIKRVLETGSLEDCIYNNCIDSYINWETTTRYRPYIYAKS